MADPMIPLFKVHMPEEVDKELLKTLHSGYITEGPRVKEFEAALEEKIWNRVFAVNSCTSALTLALRLAGVKAGTEVITTPMTCTATNLPILSLGAVPVWADVCSDSGLIDPRDVERKVTSLTGAVVCVDWGGMPCDVDALKRICFVHSVPLIEDAAHSLGAVYFGLPVGRLVDFTAFSFQAIKHITTGDGGALACRSVLDHERGKKLRWFGINREAPGGGDSRIGVDIEEWGYKFHMNDIAATIGVAQLPYLRRIVAQHTANAVEYDQRLSEYFLKPKEPFGVGSSWWLYTLLLPSESDRDGFREFMLGRGIQVSQVHRRNDEYSVFSPHRCGHLPGLDLFSSRMICLPVHWGLSQADRDRIVEGCNEWVEGAIP